MASRLAQPFCTAHGRLSLGMHGHVLSPIIPVACGSGPWYNACFLGPTRVHNPNDIWISSTIFAQLTSGCRRLCRGMPFPVKIFPFCGEVWIPIRLRGSLRPHATTETVSRSVQPFLHSSRQTVHIYFTMVIPFPKNCPFPWGDLELIEYNTSAHPSAQLKRHLDRFSCFYCAMHFSAKRGIAIVILSVCYVRALIK